VRRGWYKRTNRTHVHGTHVISAPA
jgi:hypothetical protein